MRCRYLDLEMRKPATVEFKNSVHLSICLSICLSSIYHHLSTYIPKEREKRTSVCNSRHQALGEHRVDELMYLEIGNKKQCSSTLSNFIPCFIFVRISIHRQNSGF